MEEELLSGKEHIVLLRAKAKDRFLYVFLPPYFHKLVW